MLSRAFALLVLPVAAMAQLASMRGERMLHAQMPFEQIYSLRTN